MNSLQRLCKWRIGLCAFAFLIGAAVASSPALALSFTPLGIGTLPDGQIVEMFQATFDPGETYPWHFHSGTLNVVMTQGQLTLYHGCGEDPETYNAGEAFQEDPGVVAMVKNNGSDPVVLLVSGALPGCFSDYHDATLVSGPTCSGDSKTAKRAKVHSCDWVIEHCTIGSLGAYICDPEP